MKYTTKPTNDNSPYAKSLYTKEWLDYQKKIDEIWKDIHLNHLNMTPDPRIKIKTPNSPAGRITPG